MLHIVNKSPSERNAVASCLAHVKPGSAILFIEDAVYAGTRGTQVEEQVKSVMAQVPVYVLEPDLNARGMQGRVLDGVKLVDYGGFVDLVVEYGTSQSWL